MESVSCVLVNTWLDLGVLSDSTTANPLAEWAFLAISLLSRVVSAIGIALIIGFITNYIKAKYIDDYRALSDSQVTECAKTIVSRFSKDKDYLNEYKEAVVLKTLKNYPNCRTDVRYSVEAYIDNGKVCTRTFLTYDEHKTERFDRISNYSDSQNIQVNSIKVSSPNNSNASEELNNIKEDEHKAFSRSKKFEKYAIIPEYYQKMESIHVEKELIITGEDHWQSYAAIFLTPSRGISFTLNTRDGLIIKDVIIFGDDGSFSITLRDDKDSMTITSSSWISENNGIFVLIATEAENNV